MFIFLICLDHTIKSKYLDYNGCGKPDSRNSQRNKITKTKVSLNKNKLVYIMPINYKWIAIRMKPNVRNCWKYICKTNRFQTQIANDMNGLSLFCDGIIAKRAKGGNPYKLRQCIHITSIEYTPLCIHMHRNVYFDNSIEVLYSICVFKMSNSHQFFFLLTWYMNLIKWENWRFNVVIII